MINSATSVFPVLARKGGVSVAGGTRREAFDALAKILSSLPQACGAAGLVVLADDLQWADDDSIALIEHVLDKSPSNVALVATLRDDVAWHASLHGLVNRPGVHVEKLQRLDDSAIAAIIAKSARDAGLQIAPAQLREAIIACDGRPMLAELAGGVLQYRDSSARGLTLDSIVNQIDESARDVLALLAAADDWLADERLWVLLQRNPGEVEDVLDDLARLKLIRRSHAGRLDETGVEQTDIYHDSVRQAVLRALQAHEMRRAHRKHATWILDQGERASSQLVRHLVNAGNEAEAARHAVLAARNLERQKVYSLAADMYEVALRHPFEDALALSRSRASVLELAGRYREAAAQWHACAQLIPEGGRAADVEVREASAWLAAGQIIEGHDCLRRALDNLPGQPRWGRLSELGSAVRFVVGPLPLRSVAARREFSTGNELEAERDLRIGMMLGYFDPIAGIHLLMRAADRYGRMGLMHQAARCCYLLAYFAINGTSRKGRVALAERYRRQAQRMVGSDAVEDVVLDIMPSFLEGCQRMRCGGWGGADLLFESTLARMDRGGITGTFEQLYASMQRMQLHVLMQDLPVLRKSVSALRTSMRDVQDSALRAHLSNTEVWMALYGGAIEEARDQSDRLLALFPEERPTIQRLLSDFFAGMVDLYATDCRGLPSRLAEALERGRRFRPLDQWATSLFCATLAMADANALRSGDPEASYARMLHYARRAERAVVIVPGAPIRARGYAADAVGKPELALRCLERAEQVSLRYGQRIDAAVARYQRGIRLGGTEGEECVRSARRMIRAAGSHERLLHEDTGRR